MTQKYFAPTYRATRFTCPFCEVVAAQGWHDLLYRVAGGMITDQSMSFCKCSHCQGQSYWLQDRMVVPSTAPVEVAHEDLPIECRGDYEEARDIVARSPRAAAALIRLSLQKLMPILGEKGKNINEDIGNLVSKGLPLEVQQALDFCRVIGNNAVHPGEIDLNDSPEIAHSLFNMLNFIVEDRISRPKKVQSLYRKLPEAARAAIEKRDA